MRIYRREWEAYQNGADYGLHYDHLIRLNKSRFLNVLFISTLEATYRIMKEFQYLHDFLAAQCYTQSCF